MKQSLHTIWKKLTALLISMMLMEVLLPAAMAVDLNVDAGFYFKQGRNNTCTLASAAMMLRRRAYLDGMECWINVTENGIKSAAWANGLSHDFTYNDMRVGYADLPADQTEKVEALIRILEEHPEGIVLYDRSKPHAVLLTDHTEGVFYCADPARHISEGRVPLSEAYISLERASCYWYIAEDGNEKALELLEQAVREAEPSEEEQPAEAETDAWSWLTRWFQ